MNDRPTAFELLVAVRQFLETELIATLSDPRLRFQTLIAANVLGIAERELLTEESALADEWRFLCSELRRPADAARAVGDLKAVVREANETLCRRVRAGDYDAPADFKRLRALVRDRVIQKLQVANPKCIAAGGRRAAAV
jgi:hypothetical protein